MLEEVFKLLTKWKEEGRPLESDLFQMFTEIYSRYDIPHGLVMLEG